jgi:hypothetical protein
MFRPLLNKSIETHIFLSLVLLAESCRISRHRNHAANFFINIRQTFDFFDYKGWISWVQQEEDTSWVHVSMHHDFYWSRGFLASKWIEDKTWCRLFLSHYTALSTFLIHPSIPLTLPFRWDNLSWEGLPFLPATSFPYILTFHVCWPEIEAWISEDSTSIFMLSKEYETLM